MGKYKRKPLEIEAIQLKLGEFNSNIDEVEDFIGEECFLTEKGIYYFDHGEVYIDYGEYVIKNHKGEIYSCDEKTFDEFYEICEEESNIH